MYVCGSVRAGVFMYVCVCAAGVPECFGLQHSGWTAGCSWPPETATDHYACHQAPLYPSLPGSFKSIAVCPTSYNSVPSLKTQDTVGPIQAVLITGCFWGSTLTKQHSFTAASEYELLL
jgi:hypothetical protein